MMEIRCRVLGKVQGVGFRDYLQNAAAEVLVCGWVHNEHDGSVRLVAQGQPDQLRAFIEYIHEGSTLALVEEVEVEWLTASVPFDDFSVLQ